LQIGKSFCISRI